MGKATKVTTQKKNKTKGSVLIPGGLKDVLMGSSKEIKPKK
jgi:hypothetical protein